MTDRDRAAALFDGWEETLIWAALQGVMGRLEWNGDGSAGRITLGDFCFLAGKPDRALAETLEAPIVTAREEGWYRLVEEVYGPRAVRQTRYATAKDPSSFDRRRLAGFIEALPPGYVLRPMDEAMVPALLAEPWSRDFCSNFDAPADFARRGMGIAALWNGVPVAGAASYSVYSGGVEIQIETREDHRRRGLAKACGAALILACLDRGLYPSWDAQDMRSLALAEKLGYRPAGPYPVLWVEGVR